MNILHHQTKLALGSDTTLVLVTNASKSAVDEVFNNLWLAIYSFERQFSRFIPNSELSNFNRNAGNKVPISQEFRDILVAAQGLSEKTNGLFNPLMLPALHRAGYKDSFVDSYKDDYQEDYSTRRVVGFEKLTISGLNATIPYGTALDLGGCGKGYLADMLADTMVPDWIQGYWLSFGGDVVGKGYDENDEPWSITIDGAPHDSNASTIIQTNGQRFAVATSGTKVRSGTKGTKKWHHIIDPRTLKPSTSDVVSATVRSERAVSADVLASCAVILGSEESVSFLTKQDASDVYLQTIDGAFSHHSLQGAIRKQLTHKEKVGHRG